MTVITRLSIFGLNIYRFPVVENQNLMIVPISITFDIFVAKFKHHTRIIKNVKIL